MGDYIVDTDYYIDIVICLDASDCMIDIMDIVKKELLNVFYTKVIEYLDEDDKNVGQFRIKMIIVHGDDSICESPFYILPNQEVDLLHFINDVAVFGKITSGGIFSSISCAINSAWTIKGSRRRHMIIVLTNTSGPVEGNAVDVRQISSMWEGTEVPMESNYQPRSGRLIMFVPHAEPWYYFEACNRTWMVYDWGNRNSIFEDWTWF